MVADLTGLAVANASLLDEATAAAEAVTLAHAAHKAKGDTLLAAADLHPQTLAVVRVRAEPAGIRVLVVPPAAIAAAAELRKNPSPCCCNTPARQARCATSTPEIAAVQAAGGIAIVAADPLSLCLLTPPGEMGADVCVGSTQRFGVPLGYGGPHAAYMAVKDGLKRLLPGRLVGRFHRRGGQPGDAAGPADARAAHPPREGDEQHLHRAGAAGGHGRDVCGLARAGRAAAHRRTRGVAGAAAGRCGTARRLRAAARGLLRHHRARGRRACRCPGGRRPGARLQPAAGGRRGLHRA